MAETPQNATLDDIVFANRNKAYGAYDLRKTYPKNITRALIIGGVLFTLGVLTPTIITALAPEQAAHCGMTFPQLCDWMVRDASCNR